MAALTAMSIRGSGLGVEWLPNAPLLEQAPRGLEIGVAGRQRSPIGRAFEQQVPIASQAGGDDGSGMCGCCLQFPSHPLASTLAALPCNLSTADCRSVYCSPWVACAHSIQPFQCGLSDPTHLSRCLCALC